ncbi:MAG: hypothetical protein NVSMB64_02950 [Candidatus Velthaea sp.]
MRLTKLVVPDTADALLRREGLRALARRVLLVPLTIVQAGGGFGKSTLLAAWAGELRASALVAWCSLDAGDASPSGLAEVLVAAVRREIPQFGTAVATALADDIADPDRLASTLANELFIEAADREGDIVVFLDDAHVLVEDRASLRLLATLVRSIGSRVHVVIATRRQLPLVDVAKLRGSGRLLEVQEDSLRFTFDEARELIRDDARARRVLERSDGWPIAIGLAAHAPSDAALMDRGSYNDLFTFLAEDTIRELPAGLQQRMMQLAVAPVFDIALAARLIEDVNAEATIDEILSRGLYLRRGDDGSLRFHALFREFLLGRARESEAELVREAYRRFAEALRERGKPLDALAVLIEAGDFDEIVGSVQAALASMRTDRYHQLLGLLARVPPAVRDEKPMLHRLYALALNREGRRDEAQRVLERCYTRAIALGDEGLACMSQVELALDADGFRFQGRGAFVRSKAHAQRALTHATSTALAQKPAYEGFARWLLGMIAASSGDFSEARTQLDRAIEIERAHPRHDTLLFVEDSLVRGWTGDWRRALETAREAEEHFLRGSGSYLVGLAYAAQSRALLALREDIDGAQRLAQLAISSLRAAGLVEELSAPYVLLSRCAIAKAVPDIPLAEEALDEAERRIAIAENPVIRFELTLVRAEIALLANRDAALSLNVDRARAMARSYDDPGQRASLDFLEGIIAVVRSDDSAARTAFARAGSGFRRLGDRFQWALAAIADAAIAARSGTLEDIELADLLDALESAHLDYASASVSRSAALLFLEALRRNVWPARAADMFGAALPMQSEPIAGFARDRANAGHLRALALRALARHEPIVHADLIRECTLDADPAVAATGAALADLLPRAMAAPARVECIGPLTIEIGPSVLSEGHERLARRKAVELLRLLAIKAAPVTKSAVLDALWPSNPDVAVTTLRVTVHHLRRILQPDVDGTGDYIRFDGEVLALQPGAFGATDVQRAAAALARGQLAFARGDFAGAGQEMTAAADLFGRAPREDVVVEWLRPYVRTWRNSAIEALRSLAEVAVRSGAGATAIDALERAQQLDPFDEKTVVALLEERLRRGEAALGRMAFDVYRKRLAEDGGAPGPAVLERASRLMQPGPDPARAPDAALSSREREVLTLVARGMSNKQIGSSLCLSVWTVNNHVAKILKKLGVDSRGAAVAMIAGHNS